jgi:hypothetical protein
MKVLLRQGHEEMITREEIVTDGGRQLSWLDLLRKKELKGRNLKTEQIGEKN